MYINKTKLFFHMSKELQILSIMKKMKCTWGEAEKKILEEKKLKEFI